MAPDPAPAAALSAAAKRFQTRVLHAAGPLEIREFPDGTRSAAQAATAIGCRLKQIAKSLVFASGESLILVIARGPDRVDESALSRLTGAPIARADAQAVRAATGFAIGGIPPFGHDQALETFLDEGLFQEPLLWAAAGGPHAVFAITPDRLAQITQGHRVAVTVPA